MYSAYFFNPRKVCANVNLRFYIWLDEVSNIQTGGLYMNEEDEYELKRNHLSDLKQIYAPNTMAETQFKRYAFAFKTDTTGRPFLHLWVR